jgi:DNA polymerase-3 subunit alpha
MAEAAGDTKYDFLATEVSDKIIKTLELLQEDEIIEPDMSLRQMYETYLHPEHIDTTDPDIWEALASGSVLDVFQFSEGVGLSTIKQIKPTDIVQMTICNAIMRLQGEQGKERPADR